MSTLETHTPAQLVRNFVIADGRDTLFTGYDIKIGQLPATGDKAIAFIDGGGFESFPHLLYEQLNLQVLVRGSSQGDGYQTSFLISRKIRDILLGVFTPPAQFEELKGIVERSVNPTGLGYDANDRYIWSSNYLLHVEPNPNSLSNRTSL